MFYREAGQYKASYQSDQAIFPIAQDRFVMLALLAVAFVVVPFVASEYVYRAVLIPVVILSLAAIGLNVLMGYCGQVSLGSGAFMAIGAYAAYNLAIRLPFLNPFVCVLLGGFVAAAVGIAFGVPSLRIKGFYLACATLAAQFFADWAFLRIKVVHQLHAVRLGQRAAAAVSSASTSARPRRTTWSRWPSPSCWGSPPRTSCAAMSAASGWRSATWTSPPRSSACGRCTPSSPPSLCRRS